MFQTLEGDSLMNNKDEQQHGRQGSLLAHGMVENIGFNTAV